MAERRPEPPEPAATEDRIAAALLDLAHRRGPGRTFCPSEAARALARDWRPLMGDVRGVAALLQQEGRLVAMQKGRPVDAAKARGPIRLALPEGAP